MAVRYTVMDITTFRCGELRGTAVRARLESRTSRINEPVSEPGCCPGRTLHNGITDRQLPVYPRGAKQGSPESEPRQHRVEILDLDLPYLLRTCSDPKILPTLN